MPFLLGDSFSSIEYEWIESRFDLNVKQSDSSTVAHPGKLVYLGI